MANGNVSKDLQEIVLSSIIRDEYWFSLVHNEIDDGYFDDPTCKIIYRASEYYYNKYGVVPNQNDIIVVIDDVYNDSYGVTSDAVKNDVKRLYGFPESPEEFIKDKISKFIHRIRIVSSLSKFIEDYKNNPDKDCEELYNELVSGSDVSLVTDQIFTINGDNIHDVKTKALGTEENPKIVKSSVTAINSQFTYGGYLPSTVNMVVGAPASGKSMFLVNEGASAAKQGYKVLHIFIGDLVEYDGFIRYISCISGASQLDLVRMKDDELGNVVSVLNQQYNNVFDNVDILAYPSYSVKIDEVLKTISRVEKKLGKDYMMVIIDYPDNVIKDKDNMYQAGGEIYGDLEKLARRLNAVVMVASQPKLNYWSSEVIPLEGAAESGRKQQAVDFMVTIGLHNGDRSNNFGTLYIPKNRRGTQGYMVRFKSDYARSSIKEITQIEYEGLVNSSNS